MAAMRLLAQSRDFAASCSTPACTCSFSGLIGSPLQPQLAAPLEELPGALGQRSRHLKLQAPGPRWAFGIWTTEQALGDALLSLVP